MKNHKKTKLSDDVLLVTNDMQVIGKIPLAAVKTNSTKAAPEGRTAFEALGDCELILGLLQCLPALNVDEVPETLAMAKRFLCEARELMEQGI